MKNPFTNENSNLSNIFHNNIHRKKVESLKVRSTEEFLCQFAWLPCRFFRGRRQGRQPLNIYIYIYVIYTRYDMILCCKLVEYIESRPVDIKCCLVASRNTAKLWATHGYTHMIAKLSDQTPVLATSKSGPALKPCMQLGYKILMNKKGAMVRDSYSLQSSCKADAALVDHVRLRSCFLSSSIPVAPNARFSVPPMHVTGRTGGNRTPPSPNCHLVHQPQNRPRWPPYSVGEVPQNGPF